MNTSMFKRSITLLAMNNERYGGGERNWVRYAGGHKPGQRKYAAYVNGETATRRPFVGKSLAEYFSRHWCLVVDTTKANAYETEELNRLLNWYAVNYKTLTLDHHPYREQLFHDTKDVSLRQQQEALETFQRKQNQFNASSNLTVQNAQLLLPQAAKRSPVKHFTDLPVVFVNKIYLGGLEDLLMLEKQRKLKDMLQFGFEWHDKPSIVQRADDRDHANNTQNLNDLEHSLYLSEGKLPPVYNDEKMFRGIWRGHRKITTPGPVAMLPKFSNTRALNKFVGGIKGESSHGPQGYRGRP